jgi:hypothetical protein
MSAWQEANWYLQPVERASTFARFWSLVKRGNADECWPFIGHIASHGYGVFSVGRQRYRAHRFAWLASRGDLVSGLDVCHRCDTPACVNPSHLFIDTHCENLRDSIRKGRKRAWGKQKLDAAQVKEIRTRAAAGEPQRQIAQGFGIARNTVSQIVNFKTWAHLGQEVEALTQAASDSRACLNSDSAFATRASASASAAITAASDS